MTTSTARTRVPRPRAAGHAQAPAPHRAPSTPHLLDWTSPDHWSREAQPCAECGFPTHLRDHAGAPAHKVCAEVRPAAEQGHPSTSTARRRRP